GAQLGSGEQYAPWIALDDVVRAFLLFLDRSDLTGPVNLVAPDLVTNAELTAELARAVNRPSVLKAPAFALKLAPGGMGQELLLGGLKVIPRVLQDAGFAWSHPRLRDALRAMLGLIATSPTHPRCFLVRPTRYSEHSTRSPEVTSHPGRTGSEPAG